MKLYLVVYVVDIKLAGPVGNFTAGWERLRKGLELEDPTPTGLHLGCIHEVDTSVPKVTTIALFSAIASQPTSP